MKTIVATTDFSDISLNSVNYAADMACVIGTNLCLIHVCQMPVSFSEVPAPAYSVEQMEKDAEDQISLLKEQLLTRTGERIAIHTEVKIGDVIKGIDDYCAAVNPYAVIIGSESTNAFERFLFGGKTISAIKNLSWPLIVVPPGIKFTSIRKIGLTCDFRKVVETIPVKEIRSLVRAFNAELHVLHVSIDSGEAFSPAIIKESEWLQDILGEMNPKYHFINGTDIEKSISEFAEKYNLDLLVVIPKKHNLVSKIFQHSHSARLVLHSHVPVMAIHE